MERKPIGITAPYRDAQQKGKTMTKEEEKITEEVRVLSEMVRVLSQRVSELEAVLAEKK
jgi:hypothetical protein